MRFIKRPIEVEAYYYNPLDTRTMEFPKWIFDAIKSGVINVDNESDIYINTLEGKLHVSPGDWIIKGIQGELYPCKPDIFAATYQEVLS